MNIVVSAPYSEANIEAVLKAVEKKGTTIYNDRNRIKCITIDGHDFNVKIFKMPHFLNKIAYRYFVKSKAQRSFEFAHKLLDKGILTPQPIAYAEHKTNAFMLDSYYVSEQLKYDISFRELINNPDYPDRTNILDQFTEFTYNLQVNGIYFIDHSPGNTLIVKQPKGRYQFYLVDLNRMRFGQLNYNTRINNFARLNLTDDMINIMSLKYAALCNRDYEEVYADMVNACQLTAKKRAKKEMLKKTIGL